MPQPFLVIWSLCEQARKEAIVSATPATGCRLEVLDTTRLAHLPDRPYYEQLNLITLLLGEPATVLSVCVKTPLLC